MSETKDITSNQTTTIGDSDLVMVSGSSGGWKPVSFGNLMKAVRNGISVGGRNLLKNSHKSFTNVQGSGVDYGWWTLSESINAGEPITFSVFCEEDLSGYNVYLRMGTTVIFSATLKRLSQNRYGATNMCSNSHNGGFSMEIGKANQTFSNPKLERGNIATDWTPAPEDNWGGVNQRLTDSCKTLLVGDCLLTVRQKGGRHEYRSENACGSDSVCSDRIIPLWPLDSFDEYIWSDSESIEFRGISNTLDFSRESERNYRSRYLPLFAECRELSAFSNRCGNSNDVANKHFQCYPAVFQSQSIRSISESEDRWILESLEATGICNDVASRKEVAL